MDRDRLQEGVDRPLGVGGAKQGEKGTMVSSRDTRSTVRPT